MDAFSVSTGEAELGKGVYLYVIPNTTTSDNANRATVVGSVNISEDNTIVTDASGDALTDVADDNGLDLVSGETQYVYNYGDMSSTAPSKDGYVGVQKTLIDTDNDGNVDYVLYKEMRLGKVTLKSDSGDGQLVVNVTGSKTTTKGNYIAKDKDDVMGFDNVAKDDFVLTAYIGGKLHVQVAETLTGTIEAYKQTEIKDADGKVDGYRNTGITVDGENYTVSRVDTYTGTELTAAEDEFDKTILSSEATFYLDENGYLIAFGEVDESAYKYALVWAADHVDDNKIDSDTGTVMIWATFPNKEGKLLPGAPITVQLSRLNKENYPAVKLSAIMTESKGSYIYIVTPDNKVERREVKLGNMNGSFQLLKSGAKEGETVIVDGTHKAQPGAVVRPIPAPENF